CCRRRAGPGCRRRPRGAGGGGNRGQRGGGNNGGFGSNANFLVGQQAGINRTTAFGINFTDQWGPKLTVTGSYFFNNTRNTTEELSTTDYFSKSSAFSQTRDTTASASSNTNHRINARIEWKIDSSNTLIIIPNLSFQLNETDRTTNRFFNYNNNDRGLAQSYNTNNTSSKRDGNNLNNSILYRHSFAKRGRTVSVNLTTSSNQRAGETYVSTADRLLYTGTTEDTSSQRFTDQDNNGWQVSANINYTEPVGKKGQLQLSYNPSIARSNADQMAYGYEPVSKQYSLFLDSLSNKFENRTDAQNAGLSYRVGDRDRMFAVGVNYQNTRLRSDQSFPRTLNVDNSFSNILPNAMLRYKLSNRSALRFNYRAQVNTPSVTQLQGVVDPTNAPLYTVGNPDLDPQYTHTLSSQYTFTNTQKGQLLVANVFLQAANNYISNGTFTPDSGAQVGGYTFPAGSQVTMPVNLDGYRSLRTLLTYAFPVKAIKSNVNFNGGFTYSRLPGYINSTLNRANNYVYNLGTGISSNVSQYVDFTVSYNTNYNQVRNNSTAKNTQDYNYFQHVLSAQLNLLSKTGWLLNTDVNNQYFSGYSTLPSTAYTLWNLAVGKKIGKDRRGDIRLSVFDLLGQNQSIVRTVTDYGIENQQTQVLQRYFMLTFTYNLRNFGTAAARAANRRQMGQ
ncbi:MAG: TonB-dependent receptor, partial [Chitinophagaceae bacterium]